MKTKLFILILCMNIIFVQGQPKNQYSKDKLIRILNALMNKRMTFRESSKKSQIYLDIHYNVDPINSFPPSIILEDLETGMAKFIKIGCNTTPPGDYCLLIRQEGYISKVKILKVIPNQIYIVTEKLFAKDRSLLPIDFHDRPLPREVLLWPETRKFFFQTNLVLEE